MPKALTADSTTPTGLAWTDYPSAPSLTLTLAAPASTAAGYPFEATVTADTPPVGLVALEIDSGAGYVVVDPDMALSAGKYRSTVDTAAYGLATLRLRASADGVYSNGVTTRLTPLSLVLSTPWDANGRVYEGEVTWVKVVASRAPEEDVELWNRVNGGAWTLVEVMPVTAPPRTFQSSVDTGIFAVNDLVEWEARSADNSAVSNIQPWAIGVWLDMEEPVPPSGNVGMVSVVTVRTPNTIDTPDPVTFWHVTSESDDTMVEYGPMTKIDSQTYQVVFDTERAWDIGDQSNLKLEARSGVSASAQRGTATQVDIAKFNGNWSVTPSAVASGGSVEASVYRAIGGGQTVFPSLQADDGTGWVTLIPVMTPENPASPGTFTDVVALAYPPGATVRMRARYDYAPEGGGLVYTDPLLVTIT